MAAPVEPSPSVVDALVVGTAGHIDHGKTTLVRALTGINLDTLPEEKERGITIALGFAPLVLPDGRTVGLIDVPGHERLIRTMVAGASGLDAVMLCVSAVDGVMPQTREHLDILGLLGVKSGVLVVTMADLVDPELLELAIEEIQDSVRGTFLQGAQTVAVSGLTGQGIDPLRGILAALPPRSRAQDGPFRLPIDRSFARRGFGTVVTGTAWSGSLRDGDEAEIQPARGTTAGPGTGNAKALRARIRGIQVHGTKAPEARAGSRTAMNVTGLDVEQVPRGAWLTTPGAVRPTQVVDVAIRWLAEAQQEEAGDHTAERSVVVLHGTAEVEAKIIPLDANHAQLRLAEPLACLPGDHFVIRQPSPSRTLGGGTVLDPYFSVAKRGRALDALPALRRLAAGTAGAWLERSGTSGIDTVLATQLKLQGTHIGDRLYAADVAQSFADAVVATVADLHREHPLAPAVNRKEAHRGILRALDERSFLALLDAAIGTGTLEASPAGVRRRDWKVQLAPDQQGWVSTTLAAATMSRWDGLAEVPEHPDAAALLHLLRDRGDLERVGDRYYTRASLADLATAVRGYFSAHETMDPAAFKDLSGQSRRTAIPLLEWLDQTGTTQRRGDVRVAK
jgi:selenocysteine-specific elongation factor